MSAARKKTQSTPKYLVVDDLIAPDKTYRKRFISQTETIPEEQFLFAANYEEANKLVKSFSNIILCFIDCIIPKNENEEPKNILEELTKNNQEKNDVTRDNLKLAEWGIKFIAQHKNLKMFPISAHLDKEQLEELAQKHDNIVDTAVKPLKRRVLEEIRQQYIEPYYPKEEVIEATTSKIVVEKKTFDYSSLDPELSLFIQSKTSEIRKLIKKTSEDVINLGTYLIEVKNILGHGNFYDWLDSEFHWSYATASRYMSVASRFRPCTVKDLDILPSALYELASPTVPEEAIKEAFSLAKNGRVLDKKTAKAIKAKYKVDKKPTITVESTPVEEDDSSKPVKIPSDALLPEKKAKPKQEILAVYPTKNSQKNTWWKLGESHQLFCGEPTNSKFINYLPEKITLTINLPPGNDFSLIPPLKSLSQFSYSSRYKDVNREFVQAMVTNSLFATTMEKDVVVFCYICYPHLLQLAVKLGCYCFVAEPDLQKCEEILAFWREKSFVRRLNY